MSNKRKTKQYSSESEGSDSEPKKVSTKIQKEIPKKAEKVEKIVDKKEPAVKKRKTTEETAVEVKKTDKKKKDVESEENSEEEKKEINEETLISNFRVSEETRNNLARKGIVSFFPIQYESFDHIFDGKDVIGRAKTGTGKTFAFAVPLVERMLNDFKGAVSRCPRVIVMAPTRELAKQIAADFEILSKKITTTCVYGGVPIDTQLRDLMRGVHVMIGTPGRIKDHLERGSLNLGNIDYVVLDEADEMLSIGFAPDIEHILGTIPKTKDRQTLLFSATLPDWIKKVTKNYLKKEHVTVDLIGEDVSRVSKTIDYVAVRYSGQPQNILADIVTKYAMGGRSILFVETKRDAGTLISNVVFPGGAQCIHGDVDQKMRELTLKAFKEDKFKTLIATDVAARGLDIPNVELVIQTCCPRDTETFIHRSGRTGRAGRKGTCVVIYLPRSERSMENLVWNTGIEFSHAQPPTAEEMVSSTTASTVSSLEEVDEDMAKMFEKAAQKLIDEKGALKVLSAALAKLSGKSEKPLQTSLFKPGEGKMTTLKCTLECSSKFEACKMLTPYAKNIGHIAWTKSAIYVDFFLDDAKRLLKENKNIFSPCTSLPPGVPLPPSSGGDRGGYRRREGGYGGGSRSGGGYGGRGNGGGYGNSGGYQGNKKSY